MATSQLDLRLQTLANSGQFSPGTLARFGEYVTQAPEDALFRMNPYRLSESLGIQPREAVDLALHATAAGILEFSWGVLCPACGWFLTTPAALKSLTHRECQLCRLPIQPTLDDNVEVAFTVSPQTRKIRMHDMEKSRFDADIARNLWSPSVQMSAKILEAMSRCGRWEGKVAPGATVEVPVKDESLHVLLVPGQHAVLHIDAKAGAPETVSVDLVQSRFVPPDVAVAPGGKVRVRNLHQSLAATLGLCIDVVREEGLHDELHNSMRIRKFLTGKELVTAQAFQELFRARSLPGEGGLELKSVTLLFTDLKGSTELYSKVGDLRAYEMVREHFAALRDEVASRGGGVVKTIGDAIMASFAEPLAALEAAGAMHERIRKVDDRLALKIGLHSGACIAVELNERLDYFGQTVNIAARVQGVAGAEETVTTDAVLETPGAQASLERAGWQSSAEKVALKGIDGLMPVYRLRRGAERARIRTA